MAEAKKTTAKRKTTAKKAAAKKSTAKKPTTKKAASRKATTKKAAPKKVAAKISVNGSDLKDRAVKKARSAANQGKDRTGDAIGNLSQMIEDSAKTIDDNVGEKYGDYARSAADAVSSFADKLNSKDVDDMVEDARGFVRKSPAIAIGAAAVVGFLISRLVKSGMDDRS